MKDKEMQVHVDEKGIPFKVFANDQEVESIGEAIADLDFGESVSIGFKFDWDSMSDEELAAMGMLDEEENDDV